jgi:hypothetical protein
VAVTSSPILTSELVTESATRDVSADSTPLWELADEPVHLELASSGIEIALKDIAYTDHQTNTLDGAMPAPRGAT